MVMLVERYLHDVQMWMNEVVCRDLFFIYVTAFCGKYCTSCVIEGEVYVRSINITFFYVHNMKNMKGYTSIMGKSNCGSSLLT